MKKMRKKVKKQKYQIDQSGKIEQTNKDTIIAYSNGNQHAICIPRRLKRKIQEVFRMHGFVSLFNYYLFAVGVYYLISNFKQKTEIIIDLEYPEKDRIIKSFIDSFLNKFNKPEHNISFARIVNRPRAHYAAKDVFDKKRDANINLSLGDIIRALKKTDGRLRECLSTLVDVRSRPLKIKYHKKGQKSRRKK